MPAADPALALLAAGHDLVDPLPVAAQADGRDHQVGLAAAAVLHVGVVVEDLAGVGLVGIAGPHGVRGRQPDGGSRGGHGAAADEITTIDVDIGHCIVLSVQVTKLYGGPGASEPHRTIKTRSG